MGDLPRFPAPFLDGLLECAPLCDVLALVSVDKRETLGRNHVIATAAIVTPREPDSGAKHAQFLARHPTCVYRIRLVQAGTLCGPVWDQIAALYIDSRQIVKQLPPRLRLLNMSYYSKLDLGCVVPDSIETLWTDRWVPQYGALTRLTDLTVSADELSAPGYWPSSVTRLCALWPMAGGYSLRLEAIHAMTRLASLRVNPDASHVIFPTTLQTLEIRDRKIDHTNNAIPSGIARLVAPKLVLADSSRWPALRELHVKSVAALGPSVERLTLSRYPQAALAEGLTYLAINDARWADFNAVAALLPSTLRELHLGTLPGYCDFEKPTWPRALRTLHISAPSHSMAASSISNLPSHLESLTLRVGHIDDEESTQVAWPSALRYLSITANDAPWRIGIWVPGLERKKRSLRREPALDILIVNGVSWY